MVDGKLQSGRFLRLKKSTLISALPIIVGAMVCLAIRPWNASFRAFFFVLPFMTFPILFAASDHLVKRKTESFAVLLSVAAGMVVWFGPTFLVVIFTITLRLDSTNLLEDLVAGGLTFLLGCIYGIAIYFQHKFNLLHFRIVENKALTTIVKSLVGVVLLYSVCYIYWGIFELLFRSHLSEHDGEHFGIIYYYGMYVSIIVGFLNGLAHFVVSRRIRNETISA